MYKLVILAIIAWFIFGKPISSGTDLLWPTSPAPWERVDAFYYPDKMDFAKLQTKRGFKTVPECKAWIKAQAAANNDPEMRQGKYKCAIGFMGNEFGKKVYRVLVK